jgi:tetratricopeptide (TPR) repeat protein
MSRQAWADKMQAGHGGTDDSSRWREACQHATLSDRTSDPEAADYDEAVGLFRKGLRCARGGDLSQGSCLIATAFLLDTRAIHIAMKLPAEQEAAGFLLDMALVEQLQRSEAGSLVSGTILRLCIATHFGNMPGGQEAISSSLIETENIIKKIEAEPVLEDENRGILGGCLQRTKIHFLRSSMYMALGNHKKAVKELTAALAIEPSLAYIRSARASLYGSLSLKDAETTFQEWRRVVLDGHPDQRGARVAYAFLAKMALINPKLGTYEEACDYFEKSRRASARFQDIYGRTSVEEMPIEKSVRDQFRMIQSDTAAVARRQAFDSIASQLQTVRIAEPTNHRHACLTCGKHANSEGGQLHKCSRCKLVSYCSRECQKKVMTNATWTFIALSSSDC